MNRRKAIQQFFILAGGLALLPSCDRNGGASIVLNKLKLSADDEAFLGNLADVVIPKTDSPGGKDLNLHLFVIKMVDDCENPDRQKLFATGLNTLRAELNLADAQATERVLSALKDETAEKTFF